jgi:hypothetical protein
VPIADFCGTTGGEPSDARRAGQPNELDSAGATARGSHPGSNAPTSREVEELIAAAAAHPLGLAFLLDGDLCAVAIKFQTHAFTVDAARHRIREQGTSAAGR